MVQVDPTKPVMLIDTSYFIFYRYFAVYNWYKLAQEKMLDVPTIIENVAFMEKFKKLFEDNLEKLRKNHNIPHHNIIFAKDCMRDHIWRYKFYANYKKSREERLATFNGDIFKYCYNTLLPMLEKKLQIQSCEHPCSEADDIIAVFTRKIRQQSPNTSIVIVTNDNDYLQLIQENVLLVNMKNIDLSSRLSCTPETYLLIKIIMGDKSDNIPSVFPKCGEKKAQQLAEDAQMLNDRLTKNEDFRQRFELNSLLIDTTKIPDEIKNDLFEMLHIETT